MSVARQQLLPERGYAKSGIWILGGKIHLTPWSQLVTKQNGFSVPSLSFGVR